MIDPVVAPVGTVAVICVDEFTVYVAIVPLNFTDVTLIKFVPVIVTLVPIGPFAGVKFVIVGGLSAKLAVIFLLASIVIVTGLTEPVKSPLQLTKL
ncbi:MAG: hypothetical protein C0417_12680 [Chlorobiaceae bacterium]|nr:hypothetical protein [Chlorobiaceae bacterium]